jgi:hypothetical protein
VLYELGEPKTCLTTGLADLALKSPIKSRSFCGLGTDRPWRIVAGPQPTPSAFHCAAIPPHPELISRLAKLHRQYYRDIALISPTDPPINILGGYKFPNAAPVDLDRLASTRIAAPSTLLIPADLSIPECLRRVPGTKS